MSSINFFILLSENELDDVFLNSFATTSFEKFKKSTTTPKNKNIKKEKIVKRKATSSISASEDESATVTTSFYLQKDTEQLKLAKKNKKDLKI
jgi:hypothetical protein